MSCSRVLCVFVVLLLGISVGGCASDGQSVTNVSASPALLAQADIEAKKKAEVDGEEEAPDGVCRHTWRAVGFHPYTMVRSGIPATDLCTIQRCDKCGKTRHECERALRRRR